MSQTFHSLGLLPGLIRCLDEARLTEPSPVQRLCIHAILGGASCLCLAPTGSGKTLAYGLPVLQRLRAIEDAEGMVTVSARPRAIVLTATRELVVQTEKVLKGVAHGVKLRVRSVSGGQTPSDTRKQLQTPCEVLIANPQRLRALVEADTIDLSDVRVVVVDEADTLLDFGQRADTVACIDGCSAVTRLGGSAATIAGESGGRAQLVLVSATLPEPIRAWANSRPEKPTMLEAKDSHKAPASIVIKNVRLRWTEKPDVASDILVALKDGARGIGFTNRRETADEVAAALTERGHSVIVVHGGWLPRERQAALKRFRAGEGRILLTTELGGRGLQIPDLAFVLNYDLPERPSEYLHRIGRIGRLGPDGTTGGTVYNFITPNDEAKLKEIERMARGGRLDTGESLHSERDRGAQREARARTREVKGGDGERRTDRRVKGR